MMYFAATNHWVDYECPLVHDQPMDVVFCALDAHDAINAGISFLAENPDIKRLFISDDPTPESPDFMTGEIAELVATRCIGDPGIKVEIWLMRDLPPIASSFKSAGPAVTMKEDAR